MERVEQVSFKELEKHIAKALIEYLSNSVPIFLANQELNNIFYTNEQLDAINDYNGHLLDRWRKRLCE